MIKIKSIYCPKSHKCPAVIKCPVGALKQDGFDAPVIDEKLCIKCGKCTEVCPTGAITKEGEKLC